MYYFLCWLLENTIGCCMVKRHNKINNYYYKYGKTYSFRSILKK